MIEITLDELLAKRHMTLTQLSSAVGVTIANLSILKTGKAKASVFQHWKRFVRYWTANLAISCIISRLTNKAHH
jgi:Predicted transcriptional regulator